MNENKSRARSISPTGNGPVHIPDCSSQLPPLSIRLSIPIGCSEMCACMQGMAIAFQIKEKWVWCTQLQWRLRYSGRILVELEMHGGSSSKPSKGTGLGQPKGSTGASLM